MRTVLWSMVVVLVLGLGLLVYLLIRQSESRPETTLAFEVSAESITAYQDRADSLGLIADSLEVRFEQAEPLQKPGLLRRLDNLEDEIDALRIAVDKWRTARDDYGEGQAYQKCVLLYGRATGICDDLREAVPAEPEGE